MPELESVRIGMCQNWNVSELESVRNEKCQNPCFAHFGRNWKVPELEKVRIGMCQNWKVSELLSVRIGICQNWKVSELESDIIFRFFRYETNDAWTTILIQTMA